jgi:hypothetical protein
MHCHDLAPNSRQETDYTRQTAREKEMGVQDVRSFPAEQEKHSPRNLG